MSWGRPETLTEKITANLLKPLSLGYGFGSYLRLLAYSKSLLKQHRSQVPVISIGNLTVGGTGKTPVTIDLARRLVASGLKVAILSRGYRRQSTEELLVVSDGQRIYADAAQAGDEPYMMASSVPQAVVIVAAKRSSSAELAVKLYGCQIILLDDGFQHLALRRDQDLVLLDYHDQPEQDSLLPSGRLREPLSSLARADWIVVSKVPPSAKPEILDSFRQLAARYAPRAKFTTCGLEARRLLYLNSNPGNLSAEHLKDLKINAFTGIARPESFYEKLQDLGAHVLATRSFADHHWFSAADMQLIRDDLSASQADLIVTTQKDATRLSPELTGQMPIASLEMEVSWGGPIPLSITIAPGGADIEKLESGKEIATSVCCSMTAGQQIGGP